MELKIEAIDHVVLTVKNIETTCAFYTRVLGMKEVTFSGGRKALSFGAQKFNLHEVGKEFDPKAEHPTRGSGDFCFLTSTPIVDVIKHLKTCGVSILDGPVRRAGAVGPLLSVYFRDPDMNLLEVSNSMAN